jgi:hypothetical protein
MKIKVTSNETTITEFIISRIKITTYLHVWNYVSDFNCYQQILINKSYNKELPTNQPTTFMEWPLVKAKNPYQKFKK